MQGGGGTSGRWLLAGGLQVAGALPLQGDWGDLVCLLLLSFVPPGCEVSGFAPPCASACCAALLQA